MKFMLVIILCVYLISDVKADVTSESPDSDKSGLSCVPGTSFKQECNWCFCLANGLPACTRMGCPQPRHPGHNIFGTVGRMQPLGDLDYISPPL